MHTTRTFRRLFPFAVAMLVLPTGPVVICLNCTERFTVLDL